MVERMGLLRIENKAGSQIGARYEKKILLCDSGSPDAFPRGVRISRQAR